MPKENDHGNPATPGGPGQPAPPPSNPGKHPGGRPDPGSGRQVG